MVDTSNATVQRLLDRGVSDAVVRKDLEEKLRSGKKLRVKLGIDPTKPDLHLGHVVPLRKLQQFQDAGHQVVLLFGGFTATIGDPTGKNEARPPLTLADVESNAKEYLRQASKILDINNIELVNNRDWFAPMPPEKMMQLMAQFTVQQMLERDMFVERQKQKAPIYCHEILYPMLQGYDSVEINADIEIGGTDQLFNLLAARPLQKHFGQAPQNVLTVPLIEGLDGVQKMSKSLGNYIGLDDDPNDVFGKIMRLPDALMMKYFEVLTDLDLEAMQPKVTADPRGTKAILGKAIVELIYDEAAAIAAEQDFLNKFVKKEINADDLPGLTIFATDGICAVHEIVVALHKNGAIGSMSDGRRLMKQGALRVNGETITSDIVKIQQGDILKVGKKKHFRVEPAEG